MINHRTKVPMPVDMWKNAVDKQYAEIKSVERRFT